LGAAVEVEVERMMIDRQGGQAGGGAEHGRQPSSSHDAVAGIHDDPDGADAGQVDESAGRRRSPGSHRRAEGAGSATGSIEPAR
jgi:hypothetical protein